MPKHTIANERTKTWSIEGDNQNWLLKPKASITTEGVPNLIVTAGSDDNRIRLLGDLEAEGAGAMAVILRGADNRIVLGAKGTIEGSIGIHDLAAGNHIVSKGDIAGLNIGIRAIEQTRIDVHGDIMGGTTGIELEGNVSGSLIKIGANGSVTGGERGIGLSGEADLRIVNRGEISSDDVAIDITSGNSTIINRGAIFGDIETGDGNDIIDLRGGTLSGVIRGGLGFDEYWISDGSVQIIEEPTGGMGFDTVFSSATYTMPEEIEQLTLIGDSDIDAFGSIDRDFIDGNAGDNFISGGDGDDILAGHGGRDELSGGTGGDDLYFHKGCRIDTVTDFENDEDRLMVWYFKNLDSFADIDQRMSQHGDDVWIQLSKKDRIVLENTSQLDLDEADFVFHPEIS